MITKVSRYIFLLFFCMVSLVARAQTIEELFESAKTTIVCKAIQFNCTRQGQAAVANRLTCNSFADIDKELPNNFRSSRRLLKTFRNKSYKDYSGLEDRIEKLSGDVILELRKIGNTIRKSKNAKASWQHGVDNLNQEFVKIKEETMSQYQAPPDHTTPSYQPPAQTDPQTSNPSTSPDQDTRPTITEDQQSSLDADGNSPSRGSNTGLWITTIFATLIALMSLGFAYMVRSSVTHRIKQAEEHFKERFLIMDERIQKSINGEHPLKDVPEELNITSKVVEDDETSVPSMEVPEPSMPTTEEIPLTTPDSAKEKALKDAYDKVMEDEPQPQEEEEAPNIVEEAFYTKFDPDTGIFDTSIVTEPNTENFYVLYHNPANNDKLTFGIVDNPNFHQKAISYAQMLLFPACELMNKPTEANYVKTLERGWIEKEGDTWKITKKAKIILEVV